MNDSHKIKITYLSMLIKLSYADGKLDKREIDFVYHIAKRLNVSEEELTMIHENPSKYYLKLPETYARRIEIFYNLLFFLGIDNEITEEEKEMCKKIGFKLCFNNLLMDDLIKIMTDNIHKNVPVEEVVKSVIKYQN